MMTIRDRVKMAGLAAITTGRNTPQMGELLAYGMSLEGMKFMYTTPNRGFGDDTMMCGVIIKFDKVDGRHWVKMQHAPEPYLQNVFKLVQDHRDFQLKPCTTTDPLWTSDACAIQEQVVRGKRGAAVAANEKMRFEQPVFHESDHVFEPRPNRRQRHIVERAPPSEFYCPITLDMMTDPVTCSDGYNYERLAIQRYFRTFDTDDDDDDNFTPGMIISPVTRQDMSSKLISNFPLRSLPC